MRAISWVQKSGGLIPPDDCKRMIYQASKQTDSFRVVVYPIYKGRTINQNSLFHALVNQIASQCGQNRESVKEAIKHFALSRGYPYELDDNGHPLTKDGEIVPVSTKDATVEQMEVLIDSTYEFAFDKGFALEEFL